MVPHPLLVDHVLSLPRSRAAGRRSSTGPA